MKLVRAGAKEGFYIATWQVNGVEQSKTMSTRGEVFQLVRALQTIGIEDYTLYRSMNIPLRMEESK